MGTIIVTEYISLDGVIEGPGGGESFKHAGWTFQYKRGPEADQFKLAEALDAEALLLGRVTYEGFAAAWPTMKNAFADKLNIMPKYVVSSSLRDANWNNSTILRNVDAIRTVAAGIKGSLLVYGSPRLTQSLMEHDLVDELRLMLYPLVLGEGRRLFGAMSDKRRFRLRDSKVFGDGIVLVTYDRAAAE